MGNRQISQPSLQDNFSLLEENDFTKIVLGPRLQLAWISIWKMLMQTAWNGKKKELSKINWWFDVHYWWFDS